MRFWSFDVFFATGEFQTYFSIQMLRLMRFSLLQISTVFSLATGSFGCCSFTGVNSPFSRNYGVFCCAMMSPLIKAILIRFPDTNGPYHNRYITFYPDI